MHGGIVRRAFLCVVVSIAMQTLAEDGASERRIWPGSGLSIKTVTGAYPGHHVDVTKGELDISSSAQLVVTLSNTTQRPLVVMLSVKNASLQGRRLGGSVTLSPMNKGEIICDLIPEPWALDKPIKFAGMNGFPSAPGAQSACFDLKTVKSFHLFCFEHESPSSFNVLSIVLKGRMRAKQKIFKADHFLPFVDRYGQFSHGDWPGKVNSDEDMFAQGRAEAKWLESVKDPFPDSNKYGGWTKGPRLKATGFFRVEKVNGKWWFVDPEGCLFWSSGIDCIKLAGSETGVGGREKYFSWVPEKTDPVFGRFVWMADWKASRGFYSKSENLPYLTVDFAGVNMRRKYGESWRKIGGELAHRRLRAWGVNTIGNWSDTGLCAMRRTPYVLCLDTRGTPRIEASRSWRGSIADVQNPAFDKIFRARVRRSAERMRDDPWCLGVFVDNEQSWNRFPGIEEVTDRYYSAVARILKEELPNHLYLGDRIGWGDPDVYRIASRHCDVVSVNIYARYPDRDLPIGSEDKPMIIGEFHFGALDRGLFHPGLVMTRNQKDRAMCYREFMRECVRRPWIVGAHWFQWKDQPLTGRPDGECYQIGFLNVVDAPYPEIVEASRGFASEMYTLRYGND